MRTVVPILLTIATLFSIFFLVKKTQSSEVHFHSGFQVYEDDELLDFSDPQYMSLVPCSDDGHPTKTEEKVHLHDGVGDVAHIHQANVVWEDLFQYIKLDLNDKTITAYLNGSKIEDVLNKNIKEHDSLILLIGKHDSNIKKYLDRSISVEYIKDVETRNGLCKG